MAQIEVWTWKRPSPFALGGGVARPAKISVEADGPHDLGKGIEGYVITAPSGKEYVAEAQGGGVVGPSLEAVREDISLGNPDTIARQVESSIKWRRQAEVVDPEVFWNLLP